MGPRKIPQFPLSLGGQLFKRLIQPKFHHFALFRVLSEIYHYQTSMSVWVASALNVSILLGVTYNQMKISTLAIVICFFWDTFHDMWSSKGAPIHNHVSVWHKLQPSTLWWLRATLHPPALYEHVWYSKSLPKMACNSDSYKRVSWLNVVEQLCYIHAD